MITITDVYYFINGFGGVTTAILSLISLFVVLKTFKHKCPCPVEKEGQIVYYKNRELIKVKGRNTRVCVWQYAIETTTMADTHNCVVYEDKMKVCVRCSDGKIVSPDATELKMPVPKF